MLTEVTFAAVLVLLFNISKIAWDNRRRLKANALASLVHAREGNDWFVGVGAIGVFLHQPVDMVTTRALSTEGVFTLQGQGIGREFARQFALERGFAADRGIKLQRTLAQLAQMPGKGPRTASA